MLCITTKACFSLLGIRKKKKRQSENQHSSIFLNVHKSIEMQ
uniref:Uncharacterized protein n=1 Tax=Rhizophora mucronata TaxID=61149 RepID=A0A2P2QQI8_RHIMU